MPNYQGSPSNLRKEPPKWKHLPTKAIRVPEIFADRLLDTARKLDNTECTLNKADINRSLEILDTECTLNKADIKPGLGMPDTECTPGLEQKAVQQAKTLLAQALKLKPNSGGAIKNEIRKALELLHECGGIDPHIGA